MMDLIPTNYRACRIAGGCVYFRTVVRISNGRSSPRSARSQAKYEEKRRAILRAAAEAFRADGFQNTGMRDIAAQAGISPANLYYYFDSKDQLLYYCQDFALDRMLAAAREASQGELEAPDALRRVIEAQIHCMLDELDGAAAHVEVDALPPELREKIVAKRDRYERALRKLVREGMNDGSFRKGDVNLLTRAILGALNWTARWYRPEGPLSSSKVASAYADYLVRGLLP
jgi:AcrR family transcriptional regulator